MTAEKAGFYPAIRCWADLNPSRKILAAGPYRPSQRRRAYAVFRSGQRLYRHQEAGAAHNPKGGFWNIAKALKRGNEETDPVAEG